MERPATQKQTNVTYDLNADLEPQNHESTTDSHTSGGFDPPEGPPASTRPTDTGWRPPDRPTGPEESPEEYDHWDEELDEPSSDNESSRQTHSTEGIDDETGGPAPTSRSRGGHLVLAPTAQNEITRSMLKGSAGLESFSKLIIRCCANNPEFFELARQHLDYDAKTGKFDHSDFLNTDDGMAFMAMKEFLDSTVPGTPLPSTGSDWALAVQPHLHLFLSKCPDIPLSYEQLVMDLLGSLTPPLFGELDRACDGLIDYILGVRVARVDLVSKVADPATKLSKQQEAVATIRVPGSTERWKSLDDLGEVEETPFLIDGLLVQGTAAMIYGPPGDGKTFLALDLASSIASGRPWNGSHTERGCVLFYCLEGGSGFRNRVRALKQKGLLHDPDPFVFSTDALDLRSPDAPSKILADVGINKTKFDTEVKLIIIDTLAVATSGGNECTSEDMGAALAAVGEVVKRSGATVLLLHHPGKDVARGPRGWSGITGNLDTIIQIEQSTDGLRTAKVTKQKDAEDGHTYSFKLEVVNLGYTERSTRITSCIVKHLTEKEVATAGGTDHESTVRRLWTGIDVNDVISTPKVREKLGIKVKGGSGSTRAAEIMQVLTSVGLVSETDRGASNCRQWLLTEKGKAVMQRGIDRPGAGDES